MPIFGQVVVGPPGAGKSTYCLGMHMFCQEIGRRAAIINLDFANDTLPYTATIDVRNFLTLQDVMEKHELGPNGGLVFCMEMLRENLQWLVDEIDRICYAAAEADAFTYVIIDCPGQVELFSHQSVVQEILQALQKELDLRLCSVHLIDSFYCSQPATFISATLLVTATMLRLELPHVNVLSKIDLLKQYGDLPFELNFFTDMLNLSPLLRYLDGRIAPTEELEQRERRRYERGDGPAATGTLSGRSLLQEKYKALTAAFCEMVDDYALVSFLPLNIEDAETVGRVLAATDRANGYSYVHALTVGNSSTSSGATATAQQQQQQAQQAQHQKKSELRDYYYQFASDQLESSVMMALEIQEKYGAS
eukprot:gene10264-7287_t